MITIFLFDEQHKNYTELKLNNNECNDIVSVSEQFRKYVFFDDLCIKLVTQYSQATKHVEVYISGKRYQTGGVFNEYFGQLRCKIKKTTINSEECVVILFEDFKGRSLSFGEAEFIAAFYIHENRVIAVDFSESVESLSSYSDIEVIDKEYEKYNFFNRNFQKEYIILGKREDNYIIDEDGTQVSCPAYTGTAKHISFLGEYREGRKSAKDIVPIDEKPTKLDRYRRLFIKGRPHSEDKEDFICIYDEKQQKYIRKFSLFFNSCYVGILNDGTVCGAKKYKSFSDFLGFFSLYGNGFIEIKKEKDKVIIEFSDDAEEDFLKFFREMLIN